MAVLFNKLVHFVLCFSLHSSRQQQGAKNAGGTVRKTAGWQVSITASWEGESNWWTSMAVAWILTTEKSHKTDSLPWRKWKLGINIRSTVKQKYQWIFIMKEQTQFWKAIFKMPPTSQIFDIFSRDFVYSLELSPTTNCDLHYIIQRLRVHKAYPKVQIWYIIDVTYRVCVCLIIYWTL